MSIVIKFILYRLKINDNGKESNTFFLNTTFFTTLRKRKVKSIVWWSKKRNIFNKKVVFIPIHKEPQHWLLCVVVNLEKFTKRDKVNEYDNKAPCIFLFD